MLKIIGDARPNEIYNLAAQSHVKVSFELPEYTSMVDAIGCLKILEIIKTLKLQNKVYQASTSEMYGSSPPPQMKKHNLNLHRHMGQQNYMLIGLLEVIESSYKIFASIEFFNHEGPYRGDTFVSKKIVKAAVKIKKGNKKIIFRKFICKKGLGRCRGLCSRYLKILQQKNQMILFWQQEKVIPLRNLQAEHLKN